MRAIERYETHPAALLTARRFLSEELEGRDVDERDLPAALDAAIALQDVPRAEWVARSQWEQIVVSIAIALRRTAGVRQGGYPRAVAAFRALLQGEKS